VGLAIDRILSCGNLRGRKSRWHLRRDSQAGRFMDIELTNLAQSIDNTALDW
jgi:hypothetical protein